MVRRLVDLLFALGCLLATAPLMLLIALAIKLDSAGPVLYRPLMLGQGGRPFRLLRFRTMNPDRSSDLQPGERLTGVGRLIRDLSLDHLPALLNLLRGDLTLIGPRPMEPEYVDPQDPEWRAYLRLKPGLFNYAVLKLGRTFGPSSGDNLPLKRALELDYARRRSLWFDLTLSFRMVWAHLVSRGNVKARGRPDPALARRADRDRPRQAGGVRFGPPGGQSGVASERTTTIITGANRGLGYQTARALAADRSRTLVLAGRDLKGLIRAAGRLQAETGNSNLVPLELDLASLESVRAFAADLARRDLPPLTTLIGNAGVSKRSADERSVDGYEVTFATNHLGHFALVNLLLDRLKRPARILLVSSGAHDPAGAGGPMQPPRYVKAEWLAYPERDPDRPARCGVAGGQAYTTSKLCTLLFSYELARRLEATGLSTPDRPITVNAFDPGLMAGTGLARESQPLVRLAWYAAMPLVTRLTGIGRTPARSGADLAYLATAPELAAVTGRYFSGREMVASSAESYDRDKAADLWRTSVALSRLAPHESPLLERPTAQGSGGDNR